MHMGMVAPIRALKAKRRTSADQAAGVELAPMSGVNDFGRSEAVEQETAVGLGWRRRLHSAGDGALETTVDQALIRGLDTAFRVFVSGLIRCLEGGGRAEPGHVVSSGVPLRGP